MPTSRRGERCCLGGWLAGRVSRVVCKQGVEGSSPFASTGFLQVRATLSSQPIGFVRGCCSRSTAMWPYFGGPCAVSPALSDAQCGWMTVAFGSRLLCACCPSRGYRFEPGRRRAVGRDPRRGGAGQVSPDIRRYVLRAGRCRGSRGGRRRGPCRLRCLRVRCVGGSVAGRYPAGRRATTRSSACRGKPRRQHLDVERRRRDRRPSAAVGSPRALRFRRSGQGVPWSCGALGAHTPRCRRRGPRTRRCSYQPVACRELNARTGGYPSEQGVRGVATLGGHGPVERARRRSPCDRRTGDPVLRESQAW